MLSKYKQFEKFLSHEALRYGNLICGESGRKISEGESQLQI